MRRRLAQERRAAIGIGLALGLVAAAASTANAQSLSVPSAAKNAGNTGDDFSDGLITSYQRKTTVLVVSSSTSVFRVRYQEIVEADVGVGGSDVTESQNSDYTISFTATAPGAYRLNVSTSVKGAFTVVDDGDNGSVDMSAINGTQTGGTLESGTLSIPDPGSVSTSGNIDQGIDITRAAAITGTSNGVAQAHTLRFTWSASATSDAGFLTGGSEAALRLGLPSTLGNQTAGTYGSGSPGNRQQAPDGHWVAVTPDSRR